MNESGHELLVNNVKSNSVSCTLHSSYQVAELLDGFNLLLQEMTFEVVTEVRVIATSCYFMHGQQRLVHALLQLQCGLYGTQRASPLPCDRPGDVLKNDPASTLVLVLDQVVGMLALLLGLLREEVGKSVQGLVVSVKESSLKMTQINR